MQSIEARLKKHFGSNQPRMAKLATRIDYTSGIAYDEFAFQTASGKFKTLVLERGKASDLKQLHHALLNADAEIPSDRRKALPELQTIIGEAPKEKIHCAAQVGWSIDRKMFSLHGRMLGASSEQHEPPLWVSQRLRHVPKPQGDLKNWLQIAKLSRYSSRLTLGLSAAFAAPLQLFSGLQPSGINLFGGSKTGKTTVALAAASVYGIGDEPKLNNWDVTLSGFQQIASNFNDHLLILNEIAVIRAQSRVDVYETVRRFIYGYSEGAEATRHSASAFAAVGATSTWRGLFLSTSESSITELARQHGKERDEGEFARCVDVPAVGPGSTTVFDGAPSEVKDKEEWAHQQLRLIRNIATSHHGVAFSRYINFLLAADQAQLTKKIRACMDEFTAAVAVGEQAGALRHAGLNFALIYAGGCLAVEAQVLPREKAKLLGQIRKCFDAAVRLMPLKEAVERIAVQTLMSRIAQPTWEPLPKPGDEVTDQQRSSRSRFAHSVDGRSVLSVGLDEFDGWFPDTAHRDAALRHLQSKQLLRLKEYRTLDRQKLRVDDYAKYQKVGGQNWRCVQFFEPRASAKKA